MGRGTIVDGGADGRYRLQRIEAPLDVAQQIAKASAQKKALSDAGDALYLKQQWLVQEVNAARLSLEALLTDWMKRLAAGLEGDPPINPADPDQQDAVPAWQSGLLEAHNLIRVEHGLNTLQLRAELSTSAQGHAAWLADHDTSGHTGVNGSSPRDRIVAAGYPTGPGGGTSENQACGQMSVAMVMEGWMGSPGHRANILEGRFEDVGFGYVYLAGSTYRHFWVVNFGRMPQ